MENTIAAVSSAMNESGIGIIRVSGPEAFEIVSRVFVPYKKEKNILLSRSHTIHYGFIKDQGVVLDEVLLMLMRGPHTYTGEDTIEIDSHGGILPMQNILKAVIRNGASLAEPGEFTKRAFLNGRIDLTQAEAVMDVIRAKNDRALQNSLNQLQGSVKEKVQTIRNRLIHEIAFIESALDDPEHYSLDDYSASLKITVTKEKEKLKKLIESSDNGKLIKEGIKTVILGKPNAGKSSILNLFLGEEKAIVTNVEGTTRDILEEYINIQGVSLRLIDTAGIRETDNIVEQIGVERARKKAEEADLILYVADSSRPLDENDQEVLKLIKGKTVIVLYNKTDLSPAFQPEDITDLLQDISQENEISIISVSAVNQTGIDLLKNKIRELFYQGDIDTGEEIYITNMRHKEALLQASESLDLVLAGIEDGYPEDFLSIDLTNACDSLGKITGESVGEDLINEIFSQFCMGK